MNLVNNVKDKWDECQFKKLEKKVIQLQGEISRLQGQQENLQTTVIAATPAEEKYRPAIKENSEKLLDKKTGRDKGEKSPCINRPDELRKEGIKQCTTTRKENVKKTQQKSPTNGETSLKELRTTHVMTKRQGNKIVKRCHFCRKRGHLKKNCPIKQKCWNWMKGVQREEWKSYGHEQYRLPSTCV